jgi:short-subunit dehydrogenase
MINQGSKAKALITGASSGLGAAFADTLSSRGIGVLNLDIAQSPNHQTMLCDLGKSDGLNQVLVELQSLAKAQGLFSHVILNAGISATGPFETLPVEAMLRVIRINSEAPMMIASYLLGNGLIAKGGQIILVSSLSHFTGYPGAAAYAASKSALAIFGASIRKAAKTRGVSVTVAFPGPLKTNHAARHAPDGAKASSRMEPMHAAELILRDAAQRKAQSVPGTQNKLASLGGRLLPNAMTNLMRRVIFERLTRSEY